MPSPARPATRPLLRELRAEHAVSIANVPAGLSGTIPGGYSVTVGDDGSSHATVTLAGRVVNEGTLDVPFGGDPVALDTGLANLGAFDVSGAVTATLGSGQAWANGTDGSDATLTDDGSITAVSAPGRSAPFTQDGTIDNAGSLEVAEPVEIAGGSICGNPLEVGSLEDNLGGTLAWAPQLNPGAGCATGETADDVQVDGVPVTLTSDIPAKYTLLLTGVDVHNQAQAHAQLGDGPHRQRNPGHVLDGQESVRDQLLLDWRDRPRQRLNRRRSTRFQPAERIREGPLLGWASRLLGDVSLSRSSRRTP